MRALGNASLMVLLVLAGPGNAEDVKAPSCCGVTFTSEKCECPAGKQSGCPCASCTRDKDCACITALAKGKGVIRGKVDNRYVKKYGAVVFIEEMPGFTFEPSEKPANLDQQGKVFRPRILPILVGRTVDFLNNDDFEHNVFSPDGEKYNLGTWTKGQVRSYTFKRPGTYVQLCSIHPEMVGYVFVSKTPYFATVEKDGSFRIANVPPGKWKLKVWNERFRKASLKKEFEVTVTADEVAEVTLKP